jgi:endonuclease/exonuclease/phosphatase family metal-dependent hydrolase
VGVAKVREQRSSEQTCEESENCALHRELPTKPVRGDILALQEVDVNARRNGNRKTCEDLARDLGMNCAFAAEFEELGQRVSCSPALHGQAMLTALAIRSPRILRCVRSSP